MSLEIVRLATRQPTHTHRTEILLLDEIDVDARCLELSQKQAQLNIKPVDTLEKNKQIRVRRSKRNWQRVKSNPELLQAQMRRLEKWRKENPDKQKQCVKNWREANPERTKEIQRNHYHRKKDNPEYKAACNARNRASYHKKKASMTPEEWKKRSDEQYQKRKARMLITAKQLALKVNLAPNTVIRKLREAGIPATKKNTKTNIDFGVATRDAQNYYNLNQAMAVFQK